MEPTGDRKPSRAPETAEFAAIVPSRVALTELARGFLILNGRDPGRAAQFAATFLREHLGPEEEFSLRQPPRLPQVRRGAWASLPPSGLI